MLNFFKFLIPRNNADWVEWTLFVVMAILCLFLAVVLVAALFTFLNWVYRNLFFDFSFKPIKTHIGKVLNMEYEAPRTQTVFNGKTTTVHHTPEKNKVTFKTEVGETTLDSDTLYQRVRIGETVWVRSQERYIQPKFWHGEWSFDGNRLISVMSEKDQIVEFNDEKEANYGQR